MMKTNFKTLALLFAVAIFTVGCAQTPKVKEAQVVDALVSGGGVAKVYTSTRPETVEMVGKGDAYSGSDETWGALATIPTEKISAEKRAHDGYTLYGFSAVNNRDTREEAESVALALCEADGEAGCAVNYVFQGQCIFVYYADNQSRAYGWAIGDDAQTTHQTAFDICAENSGEGERACRSFYQSCP